MVVWEPNHGSPKPLDVEPLEIEETSTSTPQELALYTQKVFRTFAVFAHGLLAGFALWQCIVVYTLQKPSR